MMLFLLIQSSDPCEQRRDSDGGVAPGLHDAGLLLPRGVHGDPQEECRPQSGPRNFEERRKHNQELQWGKC